MQVLWFGLVLAFSMELFTVWLRFGLGLQATRDTSIMGALTCGIRIHHGYVGVLVILFAHVFARPAGLCNFLLMVGIALVVSDAVHHLLVLWPITGSPQFDLMYRDLKKGP